MTSEGLARSTSIDSAVRDCALSQRRMPYRYIYEETEIVVLPAQVLGGQPLCPVHLTLCNFSGACLREQRTVAISLALRSTVPRPSVTSCRAAFYSQESRNFIPKKLELQVKVLPFPSLPTSPHTPSLPCYWDCTKPVVFLLIAASFPRKDPVDHLYIRLSTTSEITGNFN